MEKSITLQIKTIDNLIMRIILFDMKKRDKTCMSPIQINIIKYLVKNKDKSVFQNDLEKAFHLRKSTISGVINTMEKNGLVVRKNSSIDGRKKEIILTEKIEGHKCEVRKHLNDFEKTIEKGISKEDLDIFYKVTDQVIDNLKERNNI